MVSSLMLHLARHGVGLEQHTILPGDPEPAWLRRNAEHRQILAEMRREAQAEALLRGRRPAREGFLTRLAASLGRAS